MHSYTTQQYTCPYLLQTISFDRYQICFENIWRILKIFISVSPLILIFGFSDILYTSFTPQNASHVFVCSVFDDPLCAKPSHYFTINCDQEGPMGRFVYMIANISSHRTLQVNGIYIGEIKVFSKYVSNVINASRHSTGLSPPAMLSEIIVTRVILV